MLQKDLPKATLLESKNKYALNILLLLSNSPELKFMPYIMINKYIMLPYIYDMKVHFSALCNPPT